MFLAFFAAVHRGADVQAVRPPWDPWDPFQQPGSEAPEQRSSDTRATGAVIAGRTSYCPASAIGKAGDPARSADLGGAVSPGCIPRVRGCELAARRIAAGRH